MIDLDSLEALARAATKAPWAVDDRDVNERRRQLYIAQGTPDDLDGRVLEVFANCLVTTEKQRATNAEFIVAARNSILDLIAEVRAAREHASDAPRRAVTFRVEIQADTKAELADALFNLSNRVAADDLSGHSVSGGYGSGYEHWMTVTDGPTHDEYVKQLDDYLKRKEAERAEGNRTPIDGNQQGEVR